MNQLCMSPLKGSVCPREPYVQLNNKSVAPQKTKIISSHHSKGRRRWTLTNWTDKSCKDFFQQQKPKKQYTSLHLCSRSFTIRFKTFNKRFCVTTNIVTEAEEEFYSASHWRLVALRPVRLAPRPVLIAPPPGPLFPRVWENRTTVPFTPFSRLLQKPLELPWNNLHQWITLVLNVTNIQLFLDFLTPRWQNLRKTSKKVPFPPSHPK